MKKLLLILLFVFGFTSLYALQDDRLDDYSYDSSELVTETPPYFAIAGGATFTFQFANFDALNKHIIDKKFDLSDFSGQVNLWGGEGFTGLVYIPNLRVGFFSYGGSKNISSNISFEVENEKVKRELEYKVGMTGLSLEYAIVPMKSFAITAGISIGRGDLTINSYETIDNADWNDFIPKANSSNYLNVASSNYWLVKPTVNFEYAITNFLMFRVGASYNSTFAYDWKQNFNSKLNNVPNDLNADALQIQAGIFIGLFNY